MCDKTALYESCSLGISEHVCLVLTPTNQKSIASSNLQYVWEPMRTLTGVYSPHPIVTIQRYEFRFANNLNAFFTRSE